MRLRDADPATLFAAGVVVSGDDRVVRDGLVKRGLALRAGPRPAARYVITNRGLEALDAP